MFYYKDLENRLHVLEDSKFEYLLPTGCVSVTEEEANTIHEEEVIAKEAAIPYDVKIKTGILEIEAAQTPRRIREAILEIADKVGADCPFLRGLGNTLKTERSKLK